jgi:hemolysin III
MRSNRESPLKDGSDVDRRIFEHEWHEEVVHVLTHGFGFVASVIGVTVLLWSAWTRGDVWHVVGCSIFGGSMVLVYASSTLYHSARHPGRKLFFQRLDHIAIYLLIAGTYTPFALTKIPGPAGSNLLMGIWALAVIGILFEFVQTDQERIGSLILYNVMGWLFIFTLGPFVEGIETGGLILLALGGISYTIGVAFYVRDHLPYNHAIWHGFVMGGSAFHFSSVLGFVVP